MRLKLFYLVATLCLILTPIAFLYYLEAQWRWAALGIISWIIGVAIKSLVTGQLYKDQLPRFNIYLQAILEGTISAITELAAAAIFLSQTGLSMTNALAFGVAIGVFEILFTFMLGVLELIDESEDAAALTLTDKLTWVSGWFIIERSIALIGHITSRYLIYLAFAQHQSEIAVVSLILFTITDGLASYGLLAKWDWESSRILIRFYSVLAVVNLIEILAIWYFKK
jgi:hypothetical protein